MHDDDLAPGQHELFGDELRQTGHDALAHFARADAQRDVVGAVDLQIGAQGGAPRGGGRRGASRATGPRLRAGERHGERDGEGCARAGDDGAPALDDDLLLVGDSPPIKRVRDLIARAAPTGAAVLIHGEAGTGKDLVARLLHARSGRPGELMRVDVRGLGDDAPDAIGEAALEAHGGTLFLDEVADLSTPAQARLLAVLDAAPDLRLISATRRGGEGLIRLRDDLLGRLNTVEIVLPTLTARGDDLTLLLEHFVRLFARRYGRPPKPLDTSAVEMLRVQPPVGQVRGLRQAAERAVVLSEGDVLTAADFAAPTPGAASPAGAPDFNLSRSERSMVEAALKRHGHNVSQAARDLGLTRAALYRRMVKHGL